MDPLGDAIGHAVGRRVRSLASLRGGDVADAYRVELAGGATVFAKTHRSPPPGFFTTEAAGLAWLQESGALPVPEVLAVSDDAPALLVLEWIDEDRSGRPDDADFGRRLAALHGAGAAGFGREDRRTTGSRGLPNDPAPTWAEFFALRRLRPIAGLLAAGGHPGLGARLDAMADRLLAGDAVSGPPEAPARLHGDLWAGNRIVDRTGRSWIIDPACFGGHREFDLAMMRLFGGFGPAAFAAYQEAAPLADGWQRRVALHQLAPVGIHAVKFGGGYVPSLVRLLDDLER